MIVLLLVAIWTVMALLIDPRGEFPLNDDWAYSATVKTLLAGGGIRPSGWVATNIIAQVFWGALFCLPSGFSFSALRLSTLSLGLIGVLAVYGLLREVDADQGTALLGALLLAFNPLYVSLSYTFMPDVPFVAVSAASFYFLLRGMKRSSWIELTAGLLLACTALLIRQPGLAIFIGFAVAYVAKYGWRFRKLLIATAVVAGGLAVQILWHHFLTSRHILPDQYNRQSIVIFSPRSYITGETIIPWVRGLITISVYLGLFLLPLMLFSGRRLKVLSRSRWLNFMTLVFAVLAAYALRDQRMPLLTNVIYDLGLGPPALHDGFVDLGLGSGVCQETLLRGRSIPSAGTAFWLVVTLLGLLGAVVLVGATLHAVGKACKLLPMASEKRELMVILLASGLIYLVPLSILAVTEMAFDRYLLCLVPVGIVILFLQVGGVEATKAGLLTKSLAAASLILYGAFAVAGTHDYLSWNRARWQALNNLTAEKRIRPEDIDGGFEFNGWYLYEPTYRVAPGKSWWWVAKDDFMVAFGPVPGFTEIKRYPFRRWLPPGEASILMLQKTPASFSGQSFDDLRTVARQLGGGAGK